MRPSPLRRLALCRPVRSLCRASAIVLALVAAAIIATGPAAAQRTPSPPGATVYFIDLKDGSRIPEKFELRFGLRNMGLAPAGLVKPGTGHHHLLVDAPVPPLDQPIPNDPQHLHFGAGQTEAEVTLPLGEHTLQLIMGDQDHVPHDPPVMSERIRVTVVPAAAAPAMGQARSAMPAAAAEPASRPAPKAGEPSVYFVYPHNGDYIYPTSTIRFGLSGMGVAPAGVAKPGTGHHHLLIDTPLPPLDKPIPNDPKHLHFGAGQTEVKLTLPLGEHTLQLVLGDENHVPHNPPVISEPIKVIVRMGGPRRRHR